MIERSLERAFQTLHQRTERPVPWSGDAEARWSETEFSRNYARAAVRDAVTTSQELEHIVAAAELSIHPTSQELKDVLDLGCGDGRLLLPLARMGHRGFGFDLGPSPVNTLKELAGRHSLAVEAITADLRSFSKGELSLGPREGFDLALLSFGTLGAVPRPEGIELLSALSRRMKPGGIVHLDTGLSVGFAEELDGRQEWWTSEDFVPGRGAQLVLDDQAYYTKERVFVRRTYSIFLDGSSRFTELTQTSQLYECEELSEILNEEGFEVEERSGDFLGTPYDSVSSENLVLVARKK